MSDMTVAKQMYPKVYVVRAGGSGEDEERVLDRGLAIIGFSGIPSLEGAKEYGDVFEIVKAAAPDKPIRHIGNISGQLWAFALAMQNGDTVVLPRKLTSQIALGRVKGPYRYIDVDGVKHHTRPVEWVRTDVPRPAFEQDLLYSFGAFLTVCNVKRNDAERRVAAVLAGGKDPGPVAPFEQKKALPTDIIGEDAQPALDLAQHAHDQIVAHIQARFAGHGLSNLVEAVLQADGWVTKLSPPGADGGVDILGGRGSLGLDASRLCVQVKSQTSPADVLVYRTLQGTMQSFKADQGLLVCWGGFNKAVATESKQGHFTVRLWDSRDVVEAIYRNYEKLPAEIQAELPLKRVWTLVGESGDE